MKTTKRVGPVSVNTKTPPTRKQLEKLMTENTRLTEEQIKNLIDGSKLYGAAPKPDAEGSSAKQPDKDS